MLNKTWKQYRNEKCKQILYILPVIHILSVLMLFLFSANEGQVPGINSKQNDIETQRDKEKGNFEDKSHGSNDIEIQRNKEKGNNEGKDQGSETHEEHKKIQKVLEKENFENRGHDSLIDSEMRDETKETKIGLEAVNQTSNSAYTPRCREDGESYSKAEAWKQENSGSLKAPQREEIETKSQAYQGSDNSQTAIGSSYEGNPKAKEGVAGVQNEEMTSSSVSLGAKIKTDERNGNKEGETSERDPNPSSFEDLQGERKAEKPGACSEMDTSEATNKPDESIRSSKSGYSQAKESTVQMQTEENVGIAKAQATSGEASESDKEAAKCTRNPEPAATCTGDLSSSYSGAQQMKGKAQKSGDNETTEQSVSATKSHAEASISGTSQAQKGTILMQNEGNTSPLANEKI